ncbi:MAG: MFS transporter, partial [Deltaproteobacteria bacterium]|nr:MFS transporter [Deltaproteobacteria bacterium]
MPSYFYTIPKAPARNILKAVEIHQNKPFTKNYSNSLNQMAQDPSTPETVPARQKHPILVVLRLRNLRLLWIGEGISVLGSQFYMIALPWLVLKLTNDPFQMGTVLALAGIPRALFMLVGGALTDRYSPKIVMVISNLARMLLVLALTYLLISGLIQIWMLYALALSFGFADAFFYPAQSAIIPRIVDDEFLLAGNAIIQGTIQLSLAVGPALAGVLIALFSKSSDPTVQGSQIADITGITAAFGFNALTFFLSIIVFSLIRIKKITESETASQEISGALNFFKQGLLYVLKDKTMRLMLLVTSVAHFLVEGPLLVGIPVMANTRFPEGAAAFGIIMSGLGAGMLLGILLAGFLPSVRPERLGTFLMLILSSSGLELMILGFLPGTYSTAFVALLMGASQGYVVIQYNTWLQIRTPRLLLGRVLSTMMFASIGLVPISQAICGALIKLNITGLFLGAGLTL